MRRSNEASKKVLADEVFQLNSEYFKHIKFKYFYSDEEIPNYITAHFKHKLGYQNWKEVKIIFIFNYDLTLWKELIANKEFKMDNYSYWFKIYDGWSNEVIINEIIHVVNVIYNRLLNLEMEMVKGIENVIWPHQWIEMKGKSDEI